MADRKTRFALLSFFEKELKARAGKAQIINRYAAQWDADALLESFDLDICKTLILRYLEYSSGTPSWKGFAKSADKVYTAMQDEERDKQERKVMKERARKWIND